MAGSGTSRRGFLKVTGAGIAGSALTIGGQTVGAQPGAAQSGGSGASSGAYDVKTFGAKGDGTAIDSPAINKAIEKAAADGGGTVSFPAGNYLCYSIRLKSNITMFLSQGATIIAADTPQGGTTNGYDPAEPNQWDKYQDYGHSHWHNSLIWGEGIENVSIVGPGRIWGNGLSRGSGQQGPKAEDSGVGNKSIALKNCHGVTLRDFSILHGGHFAILATGVDNFTADNLKIDTNRDGIDIDCCRNVRVSNCSVNSPWDDAICPKSSFALGYARATEDVTITNCFVCGSFEEGTLLDATFKQFPEGVRAFHTGRIKCGTESNGGFKNIAVSNCVFDGCHGLALESVDGALIEDISVTNITMRNAQSAPIFCRLGSRMRGPEGVPIGAIRRVNISNIVVSGASVKYAALICGIPGHPIEDIKISNVLILYEGGGTPEDAKLELSENEAKYPEPTMFGITPSYGFFVRHVKGIEMTNVEVRVQQPDARPPIIMNEVEGADFVHVKAQVSPGVPILKLSNVLDLNIYLSRPIPDTHLDKAEKTDF
jgi:polygalacturonase